MDNNIEPFVTVDQPLSSSGMTRNQITKSGRGGARANSGRKKGAIQKLGGADLLDAIARTTGKPFADNIAEHYHRAIVAKDWNEVRDYEKFIVSKVISDRVETDITSGGKPLGANFTFPSTELTDWKE